MARLPIPGSDDGTWGDILNQYLSVSLNGNGSIQTGAIASAGGELTSNKGVAGGYAGLNGSGTVPTTQLGSGSPTTSTFLRGDGAWAFTPGGGGGNQTVVQVDASMSPYTPTNPDELDVIDSSGGAVVIDLGGISPADGQLYSAYVGNVGDIGYVTTFTGTIADVSALELANRAGDSVNWPTTLPTPPGALLVAQPFQVSC